MTLSDQQTLLLFIFIPQLAPSFTILRYAVHFFLCLRRGIHDVPQLIFNLETGVFCRINRKGSNDSFGLNGLNNVQYRETESSSKQC